MVLLRRRFLERDGFIPEGKYRGYRHNCVKAFTTSDDNTTSHQRIISYQFGGLKFLVFHETDGHVAAEIPSPKEKADDLSEADKDLAMSGPSQNTPDRHIPGSDLVLRAQGQTVDRKLTLEIKTRKKNVKGTGVGFSQFAAQLWVAQTPKLVRAYHVDGKFEVPLVKHIAEEIQKWEENHRDGLRAFGALLRKLMSVAREHGKMIVSWQRKSDQMVVEKYQGEGYGNSLPPDLYERITEGKQ